MDIETHDISLIHADAHYDPLNADKWAALRDAYRDAGRESEARVADCCRVYAEAGFNPLGTEQQKVIANLIGEVR